MWKALFSSDVPWSAAPCIIHRIHGKLGTRWRRLIKGCFCREGKDKLGIKENSYVFSFLSRGGGREGGRAAVSVIKRLLEDVLLGGRTSPPRVSNGPDVVGIVRGIISPLFSTVPTRKVIKLAMVYLSRFRSVSSHLQLTLFSRRPCRGANGRGSFITAQPFQCSGKRGRVPEPSAVEANRRFLTPPPSSTPLMIIAIPLQIPNCSHHFNSLCLEIDFSCHHFGILESHNCDF